MVKRIHDNASMILEKDWVTNASKMSNEKQRTLYFMVGVFTAKGLEGMVTAAVLRKAAKSAGFTSNYVEELLGSRDDGHNGYVAFVPAICPTCQRPR